MIHIVPSPTADTRTCNVSEVTKEMLLASSVTHIKDVGKALAFFAGQLTEAASIHDYDKLTLINWFHSDFITGFKEHGWWDAHRKLHRHHLNKEDGVPEDVDLLDVLEYISDCVMAGMARSGTIYGLTLLPGMLEKAFQNTVELLKKQIIVVK